MTSHTIQSVPDSRLGKRNQAHDDHVEQRAAIPSGKLRYRLAWNIAGMLHRNVLRSLVGSHLEIYLDQRSPIALGNIPVAAAVRKHQPQPSSCGSLQTLYRPYPTVSWRHAAIAARMTPSISTSAVIRNRTFRRELENPEASAANIYSNSSDGVAIGHVA